MTHGRSVSEKAARGLLLLSACIVGLPMIVTPVDAPRVLRLWTPLDLDGSPSLAQRWKLRALALNPALCTAAVGDSSMRARLLPDRVESANCHIRQRYVVKGFSTATLSPVETTCSIAARLHLWERQSLQPAAMRLLGSPVSEIRHFSSYSCRRLRLSGGTGRRMSEHATANAFDISGFVLADGRELSLSADWDDEDARGVFLRTIRDGLCDWFNVTLSPDYNALHADHFHVDAGPFRTCR